PAACAAEARARQAGRADRTGVARDRPEAATGARAAVDPATLHADVDRRAARTATEARSQAAADAALRGRARAAAVAGAAAVRSGAGTAAPSRTERGTSDRARAARGGVAMVAIMIGYPVV